MSKPCRYSNQLPGEHSARLARATISMARAGTRLYDRRLSGQRDQSFAIQHPDQAGFVEAGERPAAVAAEQVERGPTQSRSSFGKWACEEARCIGDERLPADE